MCACLLCRPKAWLFAAVLTDSMPTLCRLYNLSEYSVKLREGGECEIERGRERERERERESELALLAFGRLAGRLSVGRSSRCLAGWLSVRLAGPRAGWLAGRAAARAPGWMVGCQAGCLLAFLLAVSHVVRSRVARLKCSPPCAFRCRERERERMQGKQRVSAGSLAGCPDPCLASSLPEWPSGWPAGELSHDGLLVGCHTTPSPLYMSDARKERGGEREREDDERERVPQSRIV